MLSEIQLLKYIHKTSEMGCEGIRSVLGYTQDSSLHDVLSDQLAEYQKLGRSAEKMLRDRGGSPARLSAATKVSASLMSAGKLMTNRSASKIAEMTIQGNNMGVSKTIQHLHDYTGGDRAVRNLTRKLLATEEANVDQLKSFL